MPQIILIEDSQTDGEIIRCRLENQGFMVVWFQTLRSAGLELETREDYPERFSDVAAIIFDYRLDNKRNSIPLVALALDQGFSCPMIANSSEEDCNQELKKAGCTHIRPGNCKADVVDFLINQVL